MESHHGQDLLTRMVWWKIPWEEAQEHADEHLE
jgi:hypothetical protein